MGIYSDLGRNPGVFRVLVSQLSARFPFGMLSIILLIHMQTRYGDYTSAGIVLAAGSVGQAIGGPLTSRLMGFWGARRLLAITSLACGVLIALMAFAPLQLLAMSVVSFVMGLATPPVSSAVRTIYPKLVPGNQLSALFSLDAAAQEIIWVVGPVVAVFVSAQFGTAIGLCVAAAFMLGGGLWFISSPAMRDIRIPKSKGSLGEVLRLPTVLISTAVGFFFVGNFAALEAGIVRAFIPDDAANAHASVEAGIVLSVYSIGSLVGGLLFGHRDARPWSLALRIGAVLVGTAACLVSLNIVWLSIVLFIGGMGTAPAFAAISSIVSSTVRFSETAEAFGWINTGQLVGVAAGSAFAGFAIDLMGAHGAILVSVGFLIVALLVSLSAMRWLPDLRGASLAQPPETGDVAIPLP